MNSEVWHAVTKTQIQELEVIDRILLRNILSAHSKTGIEWLYSDCGILDIKTHIQIRRMMYLHHILSRKESELIYRIYNTQITSNSPGDWVRLIQSDKLELCIELTEEDIQGVTKNVFRNYVKKKATIKHLRNLGELKKKHSKSVNLSCDSLKQAEYIQNISLNTSEKNVLFKLRSRTLEVKKNFPGLHSNEWCTSCYLFPESQSHLLQCPAIVVHLGYLAGTTSTLDEKDIYRSIEKQKVIVKIYSDILEIRESLEKISRNTENLNLPQIGGPLHLIQTRISVAAPVLCI